MEFQGFWNQVSTQLWLLPIPPPTTYTKSAEAKLSTASSPPASLTDSSHGDSNQVLNMDEVIHKRLQQMDSGNSCWVFFLFFFLNWRIIALQYCVGLYHTSTWISHRYTYVPSLLNPLPSPTPSHPSRLSQSTGLSTLCHVANSHLLSILYMAKCTHFHSFLSSSHPLFSPLCPWVCSLGLHLHCCPANRFISTIFLDYICMH